MGRLAGKRALVTAAGQGIGRASVLAMLREGAEVVATDINPATLAQLEADAAGLGTLSVRPLDVRDADAIAALAADIGAPDILFNCAGFVDAGTLLECDEAAWARSLELNMTGMYRMLRAFVPPMLAAGGGSIINMASAVGSVIAAPNRFVYGATKAGVIGMTKAVAADFVTQGLRCNAICPGTVQSPSLEDRLAATGDYDAARRAFIARQPMGRVGTPEEVAALVVYLASDESAFTTGHCHIIDGGWSNV
ncbi:MAG: SDR family oxidoreductase [Alkalilacustris sp.]